MFLIGYERLSFSRASCGTLLLFLDVITMRHLELVRQLDARHLPSEVYLGEMQVLIPQAGGWVGWLFGSPLHYLLDRPLSYLFLLLIALIALVLIVDQPFIEIVRRIMPIAWQARRWQGAVFSRAENYWTRRSGEEATGSQPERRGQAQCRERPLLFRRRTPPRTTWRRIAPCAPPAWPSAP